MKALQLEKPYHWRRIDVAAPPNPKPGEALLSVQRIGVCGTDISGYLGKMPFFSYPRIPGHELSVEVLAIGEGVENVRPGDLCSVEPYLNCGTCYSCRRGLTNCCEQNKTLGVMCDGGMTERIVLPASKLHRANQLSPDQRALVETLAIGCHAVNRGQPGAGQNTLIIGAGPIGLSALEFVRLSGSRAIVMDISEKRLEFVRKTLRVPDTLLSTGGESDLRELQEFTAGQLADVVIDATGSNKSMARALEFAAFGGRVVYVGITQLNLEFPHAPVMHRRELTVLASRNALPGDFTRIIGLIEKGRIDTQPWITHHATFEDVPETFPGWLTPESGVIKAIVTLG
ncbi:MAG TPA: zinc-binding alcohol dehydrogenase family protein [Verrucomicrobiae bacterium]|nr:zinc-binding alcohol dehydrogenase family protein [Verrucomicrobiae bacterium]